MSLLRSVRNATFAAMLATLLLATDAPAGSAQTFGVEFGLAGIENQDTFNPGFGATLTTPILSRVGLSASYVRWFGRDGNEGFFGGGGDLRSGYGNQAFMLSGLVRLIGTGTSLSAGAGVGWFQHFRIAGGSSESWYDATRTD